MPNVVREEIDNLNAVLKVVINKEDYEPKFQDELKKLKQKAALKGFRKGKTPVNFLKKMYGKGLLNDIVTQMLQDELSKTLSDEKVNYLGRPLPVKDFAPVDFDVNEMKDYEFSFDVGMAPDFDIKGLSDHTYDFFRVPVPEEKVDEQISQIRKYYGERIEATDAIRDEDVIKLDAVELEGDVPKENGWKTSFSIITTRLTDDMKNEIIGKKTGDRIRFNIYQLEKDTKPEYVKKHLLNFTETDIEEGTETGEFYEATIMEVKRLEPAELNQETFDKVFGEGKVSSEEEARDIIRKNLGSGMETDANTLLYRDIRNTLVDMNRTHMPLPETFLKRWVQVGYEKESDSILNNFEDFADDMRWTLIKQKLYKTYDIQLEQSEVVEAARSRVMSYFGGQYQPGMEQIIDNVVNRMLENQEEVERIASDVMSNKLFFAIKEKLTLKEVTVTEAELEEKLKAMEAENAAARAKFEPTSSDEEE